MKADTRDLLFVLLQHIVPQHLLSRLIGHLASSQAPWIALPLIRNFMNRFQIDLSEAEREDPMLYKSFNDFFTRSLKPACRPLAEGDASILISPADGAISQLGTITSGRILQAKGQDFTLLELLGGDQAACKKLEGGSFMTVYLSPRDYHRVHMPASGKLIRMTHIPGALFSVNQVTAQYVPRLFARNERVVCLFDTEHGLMAVILVGAMIVASIETVWAGLVAPRTRGILHTDYGAEAPTLNRGAEMGRFLLGSTVIVLTEPERFAWQEDLKPGQSLRMGQRIARSITIDDAQSAS